MILSVLLIAVALACLGYFTITHVRPQWVATHRVWWRELAGVIGALALLVPLVQDVTARQQAIGGPTRIDLIALATIALVIGAAMRAKNIHRSLGEPKTIAISIVLVGLAYLARAGH
ncbi:MAG: hypothetical protein JO142_01935 [Burkholderiales bacterium]|nr:hypothetical protein [Burkholderiales bacterium]